MSEAPGWHRRAAAAAAVHAERFLAQVPDGAEMGVLTPAELQELLEQVFVTGFGAGRNDHLIEMACGGAKAKGQA